MFFFRVAGTIGLTFFMCLLSVIIIIGVFFLLVKKGRIPILTLALALLPKSAPHTQPRTDQKTNSIEMGNVANVPGGQGYDEDTSISSNASSDFDSFTGNSRETSGYGRQQNQSPRSSGRSGGHVRAADGLYANLGKLLSSGAYKQDQGSQKNTANDKVSKTVKVTLTKDDTTPRMTAYEIGESSGNHAAASPHRTPSPPPVLNCKTCATRLRSGELKFNPCKCPISGNPPKVTERDVQTAK